MRKKNETESEVYEGDHVNKEKKKKETYREMSEQRDSETNQLNETKSETENEQH